ncbi:MAG: hypothetical protein IH949_10865 [Bacteroidetes bacterium]|nr:hypothetical protein [Bacteroidota bacterium]
MKIPEIYFSGADKQMEAFFTPGSFYQHLLFAILFQGNVTIPDIFFYISNNLRDTILVNKNPHFFYALSEGLIIPAFRSDVGGTFRKNLKEIQEQNIQGVLPEAQQVASLLDEAILNSNRFSYRLWPNKQFSTEYENIVQDLFIENSPTTSDIDFNRLWEQTQKMREDIISEAVALTEGGGLRRGTIYNVIAKYYNLNFPIINDVKILFNNIKDLDELKKVRSIIKWFNYCYHYNQSKMFKLDLSLIALDRFDINFTEGFHIRLKETKSVNILHSTVEIPSADQLLTVKPKILFEIRNGEIGMQYFRLLTEWLKHPSVKTAESLLDGIQKYTSAICRTYIENGHNVIRPRYLLEAHIPASNSPASQFFANRLLALIETLILPVGLIGFVSDTISCGYYLFPGGLQKVINKIVQIDEVINFEITPERQLLINEKGNNLHADGRFL